MNKVNVKYIVRLVVEFMVIESVIYFWIKLWVVKEYFGVWYVNGV